MFNKKLTLTATTCRTLEELRLALEVWTGSNIRIKQIELNKDLMSGHGAFFVGESENATDLIFIKDEGNESYFDLRLAGEWLVARFDSPRQVRIVMRNGGPDWRWVVGTSHADRHEEFPRILPPLES